MRRRSKCSTCRRATPTRARRKKDSVSDGTVDLNDVGVMRHSLHECIREMRVPRP